MHKISYILTKNTLNQIYEFTRLYERFYLLGQEHMWFKKLEELCNRKSALAAVLTDKTEYMQIDFHKEDFNPADHLDAEGLEMYNQYLQALRNVPQVFAREKKYAADMVESVHTQVMGETMGHRFREQERMLSKIVIENKVRKQVEFKVRTSPTEISPRIQLLVDWLVKNQYEDNSLVVAGLSHMQLIEIHPFSDGNGRLARIFDNGVLYRNGFDFFQLISLEDYYLCNFERYYDLIEQTVATGNHTAWLEFYTAALLDAINASVKMLQQISGGSVDLYKHKVADLTEKEIEVIDILVAKKQASGAEIAKQMGVTRQTINVMLQRLRTKDVVIKLGEAGGTRFKVSV
jgi:DNA-binding CsgD family transcriptional regulator